ncbi:MAG TPA: zinc-ribbon domain-containing protein [Nitrososphaerales archaeon]|nr:zinc-ribbon domain-containing protein [Nitrososphaerales archaeon]
MAYCPRCGKEVQAEAAFCPNCGYQIVATASQATPGTPTVNTAAYVHAYKTPIFVAVVLMGVALMGIGAGIYAIPGRDLAAAYCGPNLPFYSQLCNQAQSMIVNGVTLALIGLIMIVFAGFWYARRTLP